MKKNIKYLLLLLILTIICPTVKAATADVIFNCPSEVMVGNTIDCKITLNSEDKIIGILSKYDYDDIFTFSKGKVGSNLTELVNNSGGFTIVNNKGIDSKVPIQNLSLVISNKAIPGTDYKIKLNKIQASDGTSDIDIPDKEVNVRVLSIKEVLNSLKVNDQELEIKDGVTNYTVTVGFNVTSANITAELSKDDYKFSKEKSPVKIENLKVGNNIVNLEIKKDNLTLVTYTINVKRADKSEEQITVNPPTGMISIILLIVISLLALGTIAYLHKKQGGMVE